MARNSFLYRVEHAYSELGVPSKALKETSVIKCRGAKTLLALSLYSELTIPSRAPLFKCDMDVYLQCSIQQYTAKTYNIYLVKILEK